MSFALYRTQDQSPMNLQLGEVVKDQVRGTFKSLLKCHDGQRVLIKVPNFYSDTPLQIHVNQHTTATVIPMDPVTLSRLQEIDNFVQKVVTTGTYKPLWKGDRMIVNFSRWCKYEKVLPDGTRVPMPEATVLGKGMYSITINASHVYFGHHKGGETHSVGLHISELLYEPEQNLNDIFDDVIKTPPSSPPPSVPRQKLKLKRQPRLHKRRGLDEVDAMPPMQ